jgi:hypothetical protein
MSITITDPPANETVGTQFTVQGKYYCPQTPTPTITCSRTGPNNSSIDAVYITYASGGWEAYFNNSATGASTVTAKISHPGQPAVPTSVDVTVSSSPGVTVTAPAEGDDIPTGSYQVQGTCALDYNNSNFAIQCSLTCNGVTSGSAVTATVNSRTGSWTADLPIDGGLDGDTEMNVNVVIVPTGTTPATPVVETAVGSLTITSPPPG